MQRWPILLLPTLLAAGACGGATTRDDVDLADQSRKDGDTKAMLAPLVPLVTGHVSTFSFSPLDPTLPMTETCAEPYTAVGEPAVIEGQVGVRYETFCGRNPFLVVGSGDVLTATEIREEQLGQSFAYIHSPVVEGETWPSGTGELFTWHDAGSLVTPAGSFERCWNRQSSATQFFYCRGAGLVRAIDTANNYVLDLIGQTF